jgi:hypothetical protein
MKIKFVAADLAAFTGMYGAIEFKDGVSVNDVTARDVQLYGAITSIEVLGDDYTPDRPYSEISHIAAISVNLPTLAEIMAQNPVVDVQDERPVAPGVIYTKAELEAIADKEGIAGVRAIGETMNVRAHSIVKLIEAILAAQAKFKPAAEFIEAPAEAVTLTMTDPLVDEKAE